MNKSRWVNGFTIIEVLIVLSIAGLILLIVFLAVPALERNSRNTQRKHDVALIAADINNFIIDNSSGNFALPDQVWTDPTSAQKVDIASSPTMYTEVNLGYYNSNQNPVPGPPGGPKAGNVVINPTLSLGSFSAPHVQPPTFNGISANNITEDSVAIISGESCDNSSGTSGQVVSNTVAIFYIIETGSGNGTLQCINA